MTWLANEGRFGACPRWYGDLKIAERLGCRVWELPWVPQHYQDEAVAAMNAEGEATRARARYDEQRAQQEREAQQQRP